MEGNAEITAEKQEQEPLYQATVEDDTETTAKSTTKHGNSMLATKSTLSTISRLCTTSFSGDSAACLSSAFLIATQHAMSLILTSQIGYIRCMEGMEATGQG